MKIFGLLVLLLLAPLSVQAGSSCIYGCGGGPYPICSDVTVCDSTGCHTVHVCR